jgi:hypothetical protein
VVQECEKESHIKANAYVHALANITVNDQAYCNGESWTDDQAGKVYVTIFNNAVRHAPLPYVCERCKTRSSVFLSGVSKAPWRCPAACLRPITLLARNPPQSVSDIVLFVAVLRVYVLNSSLNVLCTRADHHDWHPRHPDPHHHLHSPYLPALVSPDMRVCLAPSRPTQGCVALVRMSRSRKGPWFWLGLPTM